MSLSTRTPIRSAVGVLAACAVFTLSNALFDNAPVSAQDVDIVESDPDAAAEAEARLLTKTRQMTFEGRRAGEGYFSQDGSLMVFQSEREPGNPFFQIYLMDLETGDVDRVSPGHGKTTCAWIHPNNQQVLFASTHDDPDAVEKQKELIRQRETGEEPRYSWDYDHFYDLYSYDRESGDYANLTNVKGYDAEGSYSPDGKLIAFASNRNAYSRELSEREKEMFELDPAYMMDIFVMNADGSNVRQLTDVPGYDGGPFFSPDGSKICWRRFSENGATAEIFSMNVDGTEQTQLTKLEAMSWAPYFHPSGEYLIFATNRHGFANFELYLVDAAGKRDPVRVTYTAGFDGLPVFTPDGENLAWTTNRTPNGLSQLHLSPWNHEAARELLNITELADAEQTTEARLAAETASEAATDQFSELDVMRHVDYLCRRELGGRMTGSRGEKLATAYVAAYFDSLGLSPGGDDGSWFQEFEFVSGVSFGEDNAFKVGDASFAIDEDWRPVSFSKNGPVENSPICFAGYGITAPANDDFEEYDSYVHLDVKDKWVMVFRFMPEGISPEQRQHFNYHSSLRYKAMVARDKGAKGLILVSGPTSQVRSQLVPLSMDGSVSGSSIPVISITDEAAQQLLAQSDRNLEELQKKLDTGGLMMGFDLPDLEVEAHVDLQQVRTTGRNVIGRLVVGDEPSDQAILVGAHIDHLGVGANNSSLARDDERDGVHFGADDNASGVAGVLEIAEYLANQKRTGKFPAKRDVIFAAWSGEELGTLGSAHYAKSRLNALAAHAHGHGHSPDPHSADPHGADPHGGAPNNAAATHGGALPKEAAHGEGGEGHGAADPHGADQQVVAAPLSLYPEIAACLNMDMIGRFEEKLILQGIGSSTAWAGEIERRNAPVGLPLALQNDCFLPTDATEFYTRGVPILSAFTGQHQDYHTPRDTPDKLNYPDTARIAKLMGLITRSLAMQESPPEYVEQVAENTNERRANLRAWLGTVPEYGAEGADGVPLSGVAKDGPADKAGVKGGDVIVELAGRKIENIYDYTYAIEALKIGQKIKIAVMRNGERIEMEMTPGSRD